MAKFTSRFVFLVCLVLVPCIQSRRGRPFWRRPTLPSDPNDPYYKNFQNVPPANVTVKKLMNNFLHIYSRSRSKRQSYAIEDIVAVIDGSVSIGQCEFNKGTKALHNMMDLEVNRETKFAAVTFASSVRVDFKFLAYKLAANKIKDIPYPSGVTNTQAGLAMAKTLFDDISSGRRPNAKKVVLLVTDGRSNVQRKLTIPKAQALKNSGVEIHVVCIGAHVHGIGEIVKVASSPPEHFVYRVTDYNQFFKMVELLIKKVYPDKYKILSGQYNPPCT